MSVLQVHISHAAVSRMLVNGESLRGIAPRIRTLAAREAAVSAAVPPLQQVRPPAALAQSAGTSPLSLRRWHQDHLGQASYAYTSDQLREQGFAVCSPAGCDSLLQS